MLTPKLNLPTLTQEVALNTIRFNRSLGNLETTITRFGRRISNVGISMSLALSIPMQLATGSIVSSFARIEKAALDSASLMQGATKETADGFSRMAMSMSQGLPFSAEQLLEASAAIQRTGLTAREAFGALPGLAKFAVAGNADLIASSEKVIGVMTAYGLRVNDVDQFNKNLAETMRVIATTANETNATFEEMVESFAGFAPQAKNMRIDIFEAGAVLGQFHQGLIKGAKAGTFFDIAMRDIAESFRKNKDIWTGEFFDLDLFDEAGEMKAPLEILSQLEKSLMRLSDESRLAAMELLDLPTRSRRATLALFGLTDAGKQLEQQLRSGGQVIEDMFTLKMKGLSHQAQLLRNQLDSVKFSLAEAFLPVIQQIVPAIALLLNSFKNLSLQTRQNIVTWMSVGAVLGPVLIVLGLLIRSFQLVITPVTALIPLLRLLSASLVSLLARFTGLATAIIGPVVTSFIAFTAAAYRAIFSLVGLTAQLALSSFISFASSVRSAVAALLTFSPTILRVVQTVRSYNNGLIQVITVHKIVWQATIYQRFAAMVKSSIALMIAAITSYAANLRALITTHGILGGMVRIAAGAFTALYASVIAASVGLLKLLSVGVVGWFSQQIAFLALAIRMYGLLNGILLVTRARYIAVGIAAGIAKVLQMGLAGLLTAGIFAAAGALIYYTGLWDLLKKGIEKVGKAIEDSIIGTTATIEEEVSKAMEGIQEKIEAVMGPMKGGMHTMEIRMEMEQNARKTLDAIMLQDFGAIPFENKLRLLGILAASGFIDQIEAHTYKQMLLQQKQMAEMVVPGTEELPEELRDLKETLQSTPVHPFSATEYGSAEEYSARVTGMQNPMVKQLDKVIDQAKKGNQHAQKQVSLLDQIKLAMTQNDFVFAAVNST